MNARPLDALPSDVKLLLVGRIGRVLVGSAFQRRRMWPRAVIVLRPEGDSVTSRGDFASFCAANDLHAPAHEAIRRVVPKDHVLVWLETDREDVAVAGFQLFNLARALRECG
jgi:hypothetical protein